MFFPVIKEKPLSGKKYICLRQKHNLLWIRRGCSLILLVYFSPVNFAPSAQTFPFEYFLFSDFGHNLNKDGIISGIIIIILIKNNNSYLYSALYRRSQCAFTRNQKIGCRWKLVTVVSWRVLLRCFKFWSYKLITYY